MTVSVLDGEALATLRTMGSGTFQTCVTSPPYYGLRDYGVAGQIGLEPTPDEYVARMVAVFAEVRRVLRDDGTLWLNVGDSYVSTAPGTMNSAARICGAGNAARANMRPDLRNTGLKPKDLLGVPWLLAFALRADGWFLRADIIWSKPNPMPESVRDRPTKAHEYVFLFSKRPRYFYDADAIAEPALQDEFRPSFRGGAYVGGATFNNSEGGTSTNTGNVRRANATRNARSVWTIATQPFAGSHFATMPPDLAERCIKAGSSERGQCPHCGSPWARVVAKGAPDLDWQRRCGGDQNGEYHGTSTKGHAAAGVQDASAVKARILAGMAPTITTGWAPTCSCPVHEPMPQHVLDPFGGAGTSGLVADRLQRHATLIELNPEYASMARERIRGDAPLLAQEEWVDMRFGMALKHLVEPGDVP